MTSCNKYYTNPIYMIYMLFSKKKNDFRSSSAMEVEESDTKPDTTVESVFEKVC